MNLRGGGRPRDPGHARPYEPDEDVPWGRNPGYELRSGVDPYDRRADLHARNGRNGRTGRGGRSGRGGGTRGNLLGLLKFLVFALVLAAIVLAVSLTLLRPIVRSAIVSWAWDNPGSLRIGLVADLVREDLGPALTAPAGSDPSDVEFVVETGDTPTTLAPRLVDAGVLAGERPFLFRAIETELAPDLTAGRFLLRRNMTPDQVVRGLVENRLVIRVVDVTFREGLRLEQLTAKLQTIESDVDPQAFYDLVASPPAELLADYPWIQRPDGTSLEGYLYPATYPLQIDPTGSRSTRAEDLVRMMLDKFHAVVGDARMAIPESRGLDFYGILALASIVEREAVVDEERPVIAGVYQNRLDGKNGHKLLEADPTVFYAVDTVRLGELTFAEWQQYLFWAPPGGRLRDIELPEALQGYQTYQTPGLITGPICTPSLASIEAALSPDTSGGFLYFVAIPNGGGRHDFSKTFAEHERKLKEYGYTAP